MALIYIFYDQMNGIALIFIFLLAGLISISEQLLEQVNMLGMHPRSSLDLNLVTQV